LRLRTAREAESGLAGEPLYVDDPPERDRVAPIVCIEGQRAIGAGREGLLELVGGCARQTGAHNLAAGEGDLGFTQVSEFLAIKGIVFLAPLPADIQHVTVFSTSLHVAAPSADAAKALVKFLTSKEAAPVIRHSGMEPG